MQFNFLQWMMGFVYLKTGEQEEWWNLCHVFTDVLRACPYAVLKSDGGLQRAPHSAAAAEGSPEATKPRH